MTIFGTTSTTSVTCPITSNAATIFVVTTASTTCATTSTVAGRTFVTTSTTSAVYAVNSAVLTSIVATACATTSALVATAFAATTLLTTTKTKAAVLVTPLAKRKRVRVCFVKWRPAFSPCVLINHLSFILWTLYRSFHRLDRPSTPGRRVQSQACSDNRVTRYVRIRSFSLKPLNIFYLPFFCEPYCLRTAYGQK